VTPARRSTIIFDVRGVVTATYESWRDDRTMRIGAGIAYYGLFSLSSVAAVSLGLVRVVGRTQTVEDAMTEQLESVFGADAAASVATLFEQVDGSAGTVAGLVGLASLLVTGSLLFLALEDAMHQIWDVPVRAGLRSTMRRRLISLVVLMGASLTLVLSFAVQAAASLFDKLLPGSAPGLEALAAATTNAVTWSLLAAAVALLFKYLPSVEVGWRSAIVAAVATSLFLVIGTALIGWYLRTVGVGSLGGAASTPLAVLTWIYYEAQIVLAGVQLSKILQRRRTTTGTSPTQIIDRVATTGET
jgi:membrane protein